MTLFELHDLTFSYGGRPALSHVDAKVQPGSVGLLGPNGAGKTTLIRTLLGLTDPNAGRATVLGVDPQRQAALVRQLVGYMPENEAWFKDLNGFEAVRYAGRLSGLPPAAAIQRAHEVLDYAGLGEARYRPVGEYSTGMKQRVKLAQAIVHGPRLAFLDEPTNGLDPHGRDEMLALITDLGRIGISVVLSTHILGDVERVCSDVLLMVAGEIKHYGPLSAFRKGNDGEYLVGVKAGREALIEALGHEGLYGRADPEDPLLFRVKLEPERVPTLWRVAHHLGLQLRHVEPETLSLETALMRFLSGAS